MNLSDIRPKDDDSPVPKPGDNVRIFETVHLKTDGTRIPVEVIATDLHYEGNKAVLNVSRDVTRRKRAEERKDHLNSVLLSVRNVNQLLVKTTNRKELIEGACDTLIETRGFHHVWTILLDEEQDLRAVAQAGLNDRFESLVAMFDDGPLPEYFQQVLSNPGINKLTNPEDSCKGCPLIENCLDGGILTTRLEYDGKIFGLFSASVPVSFADDEAELSLFKEVTEDIAFGLHDIDVQEAHRKSERKYRSLFDSIRDAILVADTDRNIINCNPAFTELFGYKLDEIEGKKTEFIYHDKAEFEDLGNEIEESIDKPNFFYTIHYEKKSGEIFPGETNVFYLRNDSDEVMGFIGLVRNVSERIAQEEALRRSERRYRTVFEGTGTAMFIEDESEIIRRVNNEFEILTGYSAKEAEAGMNPQDLIASKDLDLVKRNHELRMEDPASAPSRYSVTLKRKTGETREVLVIVSRIPNSKSFVTSLVDITELQSTKQLLRQSFVELAETTSRVLGVRDPYTQQHEQRVAELAREVGERVGLEKERLLGLYLGGILHDIGKIAIPETILTKPGKLKDIEWKMIKSHPEVGYDQILKDTDFPWPVAEMTLRHHERLDGSGYPDGLKGDQLSLEVRILSVCDVVEAMSTRRPYREARTREEVMDELARGSGVKYDPDIVEILNEMIEDGNVAFERN